MEQLIREAAGFAIVSVYTKGSRSAGPLPNSDSNSNSCPLQRHQLNWLQRVDWRRID